ncbi:LacI family DNA-binding transcriptional regulator [Microbacterium sp. LMC-P-041]|uniref:LacI family DNA-binding transcriptional regulator n=1 Tax=Microbacterium sp. LMC-P-041 TaxID=3040293 RepID=UPI0025531AC0|nr:LacI family DNA-binding transcriptional regulator [Microbacterium sp. LMC-P-041]
MANRHSERAVTSGDVARASGVSRATVSYVLNDRADKRVSATTRQLVLETAKTLGHVPNPSARALRTGNSTVILALVPSFSVGAVFEEMLEHLGALVSRRGYALLLHRLRSESDTAAALRELWSHVNPTAIAVLGGGHPPALLTALEKISIARVTTDIRVVDHRQIGQLQARYLLEAGHRRLAFVAPNSEDLAPIARQRFEGVLAACAEHGAPTPKYRSVGPDIAHSTRAVNSLVATQTPVTAFCCYNDEVAVRVLLGTRELGLREGEDLSIIGVDNTSSALFDVSTVTIDTLTIAQMLASDLLDQRSVGADQVGDRSFATVISRGSG